LHFFFIHFPVKSIIYSETARGKRGGLLMEFKQLGNTNVEVPVVGIGTWEMGGGISPDTSGDATCVRALRKAIELGMTLIDTAEKYADGHAEELVGEAIQPFPREQLFIVSKVWPDHLQYDEVIKAAERSLKRLRTDRLDLYLIHHPNPEIPLKKTVAAMEKLVERGMVRFIGVSNFNVSQMEEAKSYLSNNEIVVNQLPYNLLDREIEKETLPYCQKNQISVMAYWPLARTQLTANKYLEDIGKKYGKTAAQVAVNWLIAKEGVITIPKAVKTEHLEQNAGAAGWRLSEEDIQGISDHFK
jgi:diketogulonate reductase-like aldo/keto reductase